MTDDNVSLHTANFGNMSLASQRALLLWFGDSKVVDSHGDPLVVYHGTARADRVGTRFRKTRATSGPMAFFTDSLSIAENYSRRKRDTSLEMPENYRDWFQYKPKGSRSTVNLQQAWNYLTPEQRQYAKDVLPTIGYENPDVSEGAIVAGSESIIMGLQGVIMGWRGVNGYLIAARGNALEAAKNIWLQSGALFGREERFAEVLSALGLDGLFRFSSPHKTDPKVFAVYLKITSPLITDDIPTWVLSRLSQVGKKKRPRPESDCADMWDKNCVDPKEWLEDLHDDYANGDNSMVWTSIPDWVTKTLIEFGYDGIKDTGGKMGGAGHNVWIPFDDSQVKSAVGNTKFDPSSKHIYRNPAKLRGLL